MSDILKISETNFLGRCRGAIYHAKTKEELSSRLIPLQYDLQKMNEGQALYDIAVKAYDYKHLKRRDKKLMSLKFNKVFKQVKAEFSRNKEICKRLFKNDVIARSKLGIDKPTPATYAAYTLYVEYFYKQAKANQDLHQKLSLIKLSPEETQNHLELIIQLNTLKVESFVCKGDSQQATQDKNHAFINLKQWMDDFDNIAHIACYDSPQLLEIIGIVVKS